MAKFGYKTRGGRWVLATCLVAMRAAGAQSDVESAERLFDEARSLMLAQRYEEACPKLEQSQRLDPGLGTRLNLADCYEHTGRPALAFQEFSQVAVESAALGEQERADVARKRAARLEAKIARLVVAVPLVNEPINLEILRNSSPIPRADWNRTLAVNPGRVTLEARAPGHVPWTKHLDMPAGSSIRVEVPMLNPILPRAPTDLEGDGENAEQLRTAGVVAAGLGLIGVGVGTYYGLRAPVLYQRSQDQGCNAQDECPEDALETRRRALRAGDTATVAFIAGGAFIALGATLYLVGSDHEKGSVSLHVRVLPGNMASTALHTRF